MASASFLITILIAQATGAAGNAFRGTDGVIQRHMKVEDLRAAMLDELMGALGHGNRVTEDRLQGLEEALRPMFNSLPKNEHGNLDHAGVRYALHRLFVLRHGMFIKGLEPGGSGWNSASPTEVLDERVPAYVQNLFEQRLEGRGLGMHEVAILAATLEHLVHDEATATLKVAYEANDVQLGAVISSKRAESVIDTYMVLFLLGMNATDSNVSTIQNHVKNIVQFYPSWPESQSFTRKVQQEVIDANKADMAFGHGILSFNATSRIIEEIMERYGRWQDGECKGLKSALVDMEDKSSGRVLLKDFYGSAKGGAWQFTESVAYLKDLGALDESVPNRPSLIIPNYINSHSNCLAASSIYSVCCLNECEPLLGHLESAVGAPEATPEQLVELVSRLPSASVQAPREISAEMRKLLVDVAAQHGGKVPLHGRLFGQWLHHAYPRECPYPHKTGTTNPMTADEWITEKGDSLAHHASADEMQLHIQSSHSAPLEANASQQASTPLLWTTEEELVVSTTTAPSFMGRRWRSCFLSALMAAAALCSLSISLWSSIKSTLPILSQRHGAVLPFAGKSHYC